MVMATAFETPPPPPLRVVTIPRGTLLGYKACPGTDGQRLLKHASADAGESLWSGIYVQLSLAQAVGYVPNQYERGEQTCCICRITATRNLQVAILDDPKMADVSISSVDKAGRVLASIERTPGANFERMKGHRHPSIVGLFGEYDHALCLVDCETYELAVPHALFSIDRLQLEAVLVFPMSTIITGGVIGSIMAFPESRLNSTDKGEDGERLPLRAVRAQLTKLGRSELADAASLGPILEDIFEASNLLLARASWLPSLTFRKSVEQLNTT
jgi:hypothetical protein